MIEFFKILILIFNLLEIELDIFFRLNISSLMTWIIT